MKKLSRIFIMFFVILTLFAGCGKKQTASSSQSYNESHGSITSSVSSEETVQQSSSESERETESENVYIAYYFRNDKLKNQHYEKHGIEMGYDNADDYEAGASRVINDKNALSKTEKEDGDYVYYLESTNEFVILSKDGYIRTYFMPSRGKAYYDRQ